MIDALFNQANYVGAKKLLEAAVLRHQAIASNIANLETPHYRRVDLAPSFSVALRRALAGRDTNQLAQLRPTLAVDSQAVAANRDGNTVRLENELLQLNQNTLEHTMEAQMVSASLLKLRLAITGKTS